MSSQYIPYHVHSDVFVSSEVTGEAIKKVWAFLNRKKAYLAEMSQKDRKTYLKKQGRLFSNLREEHRPSVEEGQFFVTYNESLPFGNGHLTLQDAFRRLANESDIRDSETGTLLDAAIVTAITERVRAVLHDPKVRARTNIAYEVAPLTSDKNPHRWNPSALYFTRLEKLEAASSMFSKSSAEEVDRWTTVQVADISLGEDEKSQAEDLAARVQAKVEKLQAQATEKEAKDSARREAFRRTQQEAKAREKARLAQVHWLPPGIQADELKADAKKAVAMISASEAIAKAEETRALVDAQRALTLPPVTPAMKEAIARAHKEEGKLEEEAIHHAIANGLASA